MQSIKPLTPEKYEELVEKHGQLFETETPQGIVYTRRANKHEWKRAVKKLRENNLDAQDELALACAAHPSRADLSALFETYPALSVAIAETIANVAQGDEDSAAKKPLPSLNEGSQT